MKAAEVRLTPQRWAQIREVFESAVEHPSQERADILKALCGRDLQLREEVEGLLASHDASSEFLAVPAAHLSLIISSDDAAEDYPKGYRVGPYKLQHRIGRGGMGSVWLATRSDDEFEKQVAIKMVKRGMDSHEILRRFRVERQVLANLDHPNIARLIDGRSTSEGLPYLVMEYVEGTPIDRYCEASKLSITDRLHLFRAVCSAVHYAHQTWWCTATLKPATFWSRRMASLSCWISASRNSCAATAPRWRWRRRVPTCAR